MIFHISCLYLCIIEPLQKLRVRLEACKTSLSRPPPPSSKFILRDTSAVVLFVLCFGVDFCAVSTLCTHLEYTSLCYDYPIESCIITVILFGSMLPNPLGY